MKVKQIGNTRYPPKAKSNMHTHQSLEALGAHPRGAQQEVVQVVELWAPSPATVGAGSEERDAPERHP